MYIPEPIPNSHQQPAAPITIDQEELQARTEREFVTETLNVLDLACHSNYNHSFTESLLRHGKQQNRREEKAPRKEAAEMCTSEELP